MTKEKTCRFVNDNEVSFIKVLCLMSRVFPVMCLLLGSYVYAQPGLESAESSFAYITSTLNAFRSTGRLVNNPGIDGADLEAFIELLDVHYEDFSEEFNSHSAMCQFYLSPENGRMTIEEKAEIAFAYLSSPDVRIKRYLEADREFQKTLEEEFGRLVLEEIQRLKQLAVSNQRLPTSEFDEAAVIAFMDSACT